MFSKVVSYFQVFEPKFCTHLLVSHSSYMTCQSVLICCPGLQITKPPLSPPKRPKRLFYQMLKNYYLLIKCQHMCEQRQTTRPWNTFRNLLSLLRAVYNPHRYTSRNNLLISRALFSLKNSHYCNQLHGAESFLRG